MKRHGLRFGGFGFPKSRLARSLSGLIYRSRSCWNRVKRAVSVCLVFGIGFGLLHSQGISLFSVMQKAAVLSAALAMPEAGIGQLQKQYQGQYQSQQPDNLHSPSQETLPSEEETLVTEGEVVLDDWPEPVQSSSQEQPDPQEEADITQETDDLVSSAPTVYKIASPAVSRRYIPAENRGIILSQTFDAPESSIYIQYGQGKIKNSTTLTNSQAEEVLDTPCTMDISDLSQPTVLIYHTHATEAYEPYDAEYFDKTYNWRSDDNDKNMVAVGTVLAQKLEEAGIGGVHITRQHDNPSYNGAYDKSAQTVQEALEQYPTIQVILDIHRDAIQRDADTIVKAVAEVEGKKAAQLMIIAGCDDDGSLGMPRWEENFRFSAALQDILETMYPGLCRPVFFCYRKYNMDLCPNGALIEIGSHGNTLEEAQYTAELLGNALIVLLRGQE